MTAATKIDRLGLSILGGVSELHRFLGAQFAEWGQVELECKHGGNGFQHTALATVGGAQVAWLGWGGASQKGRSFVDVSGQGCGLIRDWQALYGAVEGLPGVKVKRVDIAADFYQGEVTYERVLGAYRRGAFWRGGREPEIEHRGPPADRPSQQGRTLYIGKRGNDVLLRAYEKGKKEFGGLPRWEQVCGPEGHRRSINGGPWFRLDQWFRVELELRAKTRPLPLDVLPDRDQYFAGAYPFLQELLPQVEPEILVRPQHVAEANLDRALLNIRDQWGSTLFTAITAYGGDIFRVWKRIVGNHHNERLVQAGVLLHAEQFSASDEVRAVMGSQARH
jgi:phage replication initiation protein